MSPKSNASPQYEVLRLWQLPDDFFQKDLTAQWACMKAVTGEARKYGSPRPACPLSLRDEAVAVVFFLLTLGLPWVLGAALLYFLYTASWLSSMVLGAVLAVLAVHPLPTRTLHGRSSRLALALTRYFTFEVLIDRANPLLGPKIATPAVDDLQFQEAVHLPALYLACPHGVFNYGAIIWCCLSRWIMGWYQYTGAAAAVGSVPGMRYIDLLIWILGADRKSLVRGLTERPDTKGAALEGAARRGGMVGMVPDGILGAFRGRPGLDELVIGRKRGLLRIAAEQGATVYGSWFFGTTDMLTVVQDPFRLLESLSRKTQTGLLGYYGRGGLPVPRRVAVTVVVHPVKAPKLAAPTAEQVEELHEQVYGGLVKAYDKAKPFAGYPDRTLLLT